MSSSSQDAFAEQFVRYQGRVYAYIATLLPHRSNAEDVFQQTSLTLWRRWQEFEPEREFLPWACGIAHNNVRNFLRTQRRSRVTFTDEIIDLIGSERSASDLDNESRLQAMRACLNSLAPVQSALVERCYAGRETIAQIAEQSGVSSASLYMKLHRLRQILLDCIQRRMVPEEVP